MTSTAVPLGVVPLMLRTGAGSGRRQAIGSGGLGGTLSAPIFCAQFVPLFFVAIARPTGAARIAQPQPTAASRPDNPPRTAPEPQRPAAA